MDPSSPYFTSVDPRYSQYGIGYYPRNPLSVAIYFAITEQEP